MANKQIDLNYDEDTKEIVVGDDFTGGPATDHHIKVIYDRAVHPAQLVDALQRAKERLTEGLS